MKIILLILACISAAVIWQQAQLAVLALGRIDPVPEVETLIAEERYAEAADYLDFFLNYDYVRDDPNAQALHAEIEKVRGSLSYRASKLGEGLFEGTSDEAIGKAAGVITDFFVIGDLRDLAAQGSNWVQGEEVDEVVAALAAIGVVATAAQVASAAATVGTAGAAAPAAAGTTGVKGGVTILKAARKLGKLPPWLGKTLVNSAQTVKKTKKLDSVTDLFNDVYRLARTPGGLNLLSKTSDAASLRRMAKAAETFGDSTATLYRIGGPTFLKTAARAKQLGTESIKLASTYGVKGLRVLDKIGPTRFIKYSARASKIAYKGDFFDLIARFLAMLPTWLLYLLCGLGIVAWIPWQWLKRLGQSLIPEKQIPAA
ncbi:hypothetical protein [Thiorhodovibrio winogradskyi]|uniref:hypothetical protein n=1 Tax=Thiorhodovibrio winogradskyi TaxID=77007 RepID=UPI002E29606E|nr:hypothetical protein [Thiorhodovibrio winogradskyi]